MSAAPRLRLYIVACATALALAAPAAAQEGAWDDIAVMDDSEMASLRGGFSAGGIEFNFGAVVTTFVNGAPALRTELAWTDAGALIQDTLGDLGPNASTLSPEMLTGLGATGAHGILLNDSDGQTALIHNITDTALQNIVINAASDRDIHQQIDVTLELPGFEAVQAAMTLELFGMRLAADAQGMAY